MRTSLLKIVVVAGALCTSAVQGSESLMGSLEPGPWEVGFRIVDTHDSTRTFMARHDFDGNPVDQETARPIRLYIWYPADSTGASPLTYRDYREASVDTGTTDDEIEALIQSERALLTRMTKHDFTDAEWDTLMAQPTLARRDAPPMDRIFPGILSCTHVRRNTVLFEYLASHGYIVVTVPVKGRFTNQELEFTPNPVSIETAVQDLQFAYGFLRGIEQLDLDRLGMWAFSSLSIYSMEFQSRNMVARALLHVEGWEGFKKGRELLDASSFYDATAIRVPYMLLKKEKEESSPAYASDSRIFDSLLYTNRYRVLMAGMNHGDFNSELAAAFASEEKRYRYDTSCRISLAFFDAYLNDDEGATIRLDALLESLAPDTIRYDHLSAALAPPTEAEFIAAFEKGGETQARAVERVMRILNLGMEVPYRERILNRFGYRMLREQPEDASIVFAIMTKAYPTSVNAWDSRSDALETLGDFPGALAAANRGLQVLAQDKSISDDRRERLEISLRKRLHRLSESN